MSDLMLHKVWTDFGQVRGDLGNVWASSGKVWSKFRQVQADFGGLTSGKV